MLNIAKKRYKLIVDPKKDLFRWKVTAYPAFITAACIGAISPDISWPDSEILFIGTDCFWFNNWIDIDNSGQEYINNRLNDNKDDFSEEYYQEYNDAFSELHEKLEELDRIDLNSLDNDQFKKVWKDFFDFYSFTLWRVGIVPEFVAYASSRLLEKKLSEKHNDISPEEISHLTIFPEMSFIMKEEYELLKIAREKDSDLRKDLLVKHIKNYSWLLNGYHGVKEIDNSFFEKRLQELIKEGTEEKIIFFENYYQDTENQFKKIVEKYNLDEEIVSLAKITQKGAYLQDKRKKTQLIATNRLNRLYQHLAGILKIDLDKALYMSWEEIDYFIDKKDLHELFLRSKQCRVVLCKQKRKFYTKDVDKILNIFENKYIQKNKGEIKGTVAQAGKVRGEVKLACDNKQLSNFPEGKILVALMTTPDYVVAMKKAKAIITDDGGITSHAAVVSRELGVPCIVGTKNATKVLKDGDLVEVDANKGIVKIIKNNMSKEKTLYLWDLAETLFNEIWNEEKTGFASLDDWIEDKLGVAISEVSPRKYEEMCEIPYRQGWHFNVDIKPGFQEALILSEYNEVFTSGLVEQIDWRAEYLNELVGFDVRQYFQKINSAFDFAETNIKNEDMFFKYLSQKIKEGYDTVVYSDDKIKYLEQFKNAGEKIKKEYPDFTFRLYQMLNQDTGLKKREYYWEAGRLFDLIKNEKEMSK